MTLKESVDRANAVYNQSIKDGRTVSEAFGEAFLAVERETAIRCCDIATEPTGRTDRRYRYPNEIVAEIRAAFNLEV